MKPTSAMPRLRAFWKLALLAGLLGAGLGAQAATYTVTTAAEAASLTSVQCDGNNSCPTLRDAINAALANTTDASNTIQFDPTTMNGATISLTQYSNDLSNPNNGEFGPSAFYLPAGTQPLTIDATLNGVTSPITIQRDRWDVDFRLFDVGVGASLTLRGLVLTKGVARGGGSKKGGGALGAGGAVFSQGALTLDRCSVTGNSALGGASYGSTLFEKHGGAGVGANGDLSGNGGGPNGGTAATSNSTGPGGDGGNGGFGGGDNGDVVGFGGRGFGGGGMGGGGGGMGGGVFNDAGSLTIRNSTFTSNIAQGGNSYTLQAQANGLGFGGAVFNYSGTLVLNGVTLAGNSVSSGTTNGGRSGSDGGAIYSLADGQCAEGGNACTTGGNASLTMFNTVAVNNTGNTTNPNGATNDVALNAIHTDSGATSSVFASGYNAIGAQSPGNAVNVAVSANVSGGFMLGSLANNVLPLQPDSPLIDAGDCNATSPALSIDQLGTPRPQGAACDIGAVEFAVPVLSSVSLSGTSSSGSTLNVTSNLAGTGYWLVVPAKSAKSTADQIQAGSSPGSVSGVTPSTASMLAGTNSFSFTGLSPVTSYDLYLVATSASGGTSDVAEVLNWTTPKVPQTISFGTAPSLEVGGVAGTLSATGGDSGNPVIFSTSSSTCSVSGSIVSPVAAGHCVVQAEQAGDANYSAANPVTQTITVGKGSQNITFGTALSLEVGGAAGSLNASGGASGQPVRFSTSSSTCSVSGNSVSPVGAGACVVQADQAGDVNYSAANPVTQTITVDKGSQTISFGAAPTLTFGGAAGNLSATGGASTKPVTFSTSSSTCSVSGNRVSPVSAGPCEILANQDGDANYNPANQVTQTLTVGKANQSITFGAPPNLVAGGAAGSLIASGGASGNAVTFSTTSSTCTVSGSIVSPVAAGPCVVQADQAGNADYSAASPATQTLTVYPPDAVSGANPVGSGTIKATLGGPDGCGFASFAFDALPTGASAAPPGFSLPYGAFQFTTNAQCGGGPVSFTLTYPNAVPANAKYHKFGPTPTNDEPDWYAMPGISISDNSVTFQITDGGLGDDDLTANGVIVDGGGLSVPLPVDVNAIPTLGQWGLALLAALSALLALAALAPRRKKTG